MGQSNQQFTLQEGDLITSAFVDDRDFVFISAQLVDGEIIVHTEENYKFPITDIIMVNKRLQLHEEFF